MFDLNVRTLYAHKNPVVPHNVQTNVPFLSRGWTWIVFFVLGFVLNGRWSVNTEYFDSKSTFNTNMYCKTLVLRKHTASVFQFIRDFYSSMYLSVLGTFNPSLINWNTLYVSLAPKFFSTYWYWMYFSSQNSSKIWVGNNFKTNKW